MISLAHYSGQHAIRAYLARLGLDAEPPSFAALALLHQRHVERIPWETLWILLGERWTIDPMASVTRIGQLGRAGYCFHHNGAFSTLLRALGYDVTFHVGGVHGPAGPTNSDMANHLVLTVRGLPTNGNPDGTWYVDVGLGDALHEPLPLRSGIHPQGPFRLRLDSTPGGVGDWELTHDPSGGFSGMAWRAGVTGMRSFAAQHRTLSTSPDSRFARLLIVRRRDATGADMLRGRTLRRVGEGAHVTELESPSDLLDVLDSTFGMDLTGIGSDHLGAVWEGALRAHEEWLASQQA